MPDRRRVGDAAEHAAARSAARSSDDGRRVRRRSIASGTPIDWHGRRRVSDAVVLDADAPIGAVRSARAGRRTDWARRVVFFDIETTGLSGGAGTLAFLAGCGWFEDGGFRVRQFFLSGPAGERAMLAALGRVFDEATLLVTFNGRTFDVPLMETRWAFHRTAAPTDDLPHFDMLPPARRLWGRARTAGRRRDGARGCSLSALERSVLGFHRLGDVPGFEIPARYFHFLRTGDARGDRGRARSQSSRPAVAGGVMAHALWLAQEGPDACREPREQLGARPALRARGRRDRARAFERARGVGATSATSGCTRWRGWRCCSRATDRHDEAAAAWQGVLELARRRGAASRRSSGARPRRSRSITSIARAISPAAQRYAEALAADASGRARQDAAHRLDRIDRKFERKEDRRDGRT